MHVAVISILLLLYLVVVRVPGDYPVPAGYCIKYPELPGPGRVLRRNVAGSQ